MKIALRKLGSIVAMSFGCQPRTRLLTWAAGLDQARIKVSPAPSTDRQPAGQRERCRIWPSWLTIRARQRQRFAVAGSN